LAESKVVSPVVRPRLDSVLQSKGPGMAYDTAQICSNGHVVTADIQRLKGAGMEKFCSRCGASTITQCECGQSIRGRYWITSREIPPYRRPAFCLECGRAFPWTQIAIEAAREYATAVELEADQREFADLIENLVRDNPRTVVSAARVKQLLEKAGPAVSEGFQKILVDVISESVKKAIWH